MTSRISNIARKSVVIVADKIDTDGYCSGSVLSKEEKEGDQNVTIITSSDFVTGREYRLKVVFFDRYELNATVVGVQGPFCLLRTEFHRDCEAIRLMENEDSLVPDSFIFAPLSQTANTRLTTSSTLESLDSYTSVRDLVADSRNYGLVSCPYLGTTRGGIDRLTGASVFTLQGKTVGVVLRCLRDVRKEPQAADIKILLKASYIDKMLFV